MSKLVNKFRSASTVLNNYVRDHAIVLIVLAVLAFAAAGTWIVIAVPPYQVRKAVDTTRSLSEDRVRAIKLEDDFRNTLTRIVLSFFGLLILYFTWRRAQIMEQGHITDRFTKAVEQLGKINDRGQPNIEIRLGAIYALERIAKDSARDHWPIMEILTAYVRQHAKPGTDEPYTLDKKPSPDIQAILTVLGRRKTDRGREDRSNLQYLDLMEARLWGAKLTGANFRGADLEKADLRGALLFGTRLQGAALIETNMEKAHLIEADLEGSYFYRERQNETNLADANVYEAKYVTKEQIQSAKNWRSAHYSRDFCAELGIPQKPK
jgi:hypothetical protein